MGPAVLLSLLNSLSQLNRMPISSPTCTAALIYAAYLANRRLCHPSEVLAENEIMLPVMSSVAIVVDNLKMNPSLGQCYVSTQLTFSHVIFTSKTVLTFVGDDIMLTITSLSSLLSVVYPH